MEIVRNKKTLAEAILALRAQGKSIGLVPTMGALHAGHISLVKIARAHANVAVASIFVNPTQFGPNEDFTKYPRTEADDIAKLKDAGVGLVYLPSVEEMYPAGAKTQVHVKDISEELCGVFRPGHFDGVATIVTKLFMQVVPNLAVFGEKDYQQLHIIMQATRDLDIPVRIMGGLIVREADGLAMSSRNRYLDNRQRTIAASLYRILSETAVKLRAGLAIDELLMEANNGLLTAGFDKVDYVELRDARTLSPMQTIDKPARLLAAVHLGTTRLIDNIAVEA